MRSGRRCAQLALAGLMAWALGLGSSALAQAPAAATLVVKDGLSATEIALDEVPPGTTIDQFLLALYELNPQAFVAGDLNRLLAQAKLALPTAEQANRVPLAQARETLARIQGSAVIPANPATESALPAAASTSGPVSAASTVTPQNVEPAPGAPSPSPATPTDSGPNWLWGLLGLVALLALGLWMRKRQAAPTASSPAQDPDPEEHAQGRFQPVLPGEPPPSAPAPVALAPKPALFNLDLTLDGQAPPLDLPQGAVRGKLPELSLDLPSPAPRASTPGPLDLSGLSLDLDSPALPKNKP
jgi:pilus assembly protein FimV